MNEYVTSHLMEKLCKSNSCMELSNDKVKKIIRLNFGDVVVTGTCSSGALGWISCWGHKVCLLSDYKESLKPLFANDHSNEVYSGVRERGYMGRMFKYDGNTYVMYGAQITFVPLNNVKNAQLQLF